MANILKAQDKVVQIQNVNSMNMDNELILYESIMYVTTGTNG